MGIKERVKVKEEYVEEIKGYDSEEEDRHYTDYATREDFEVEQHRENLGTREKMYTPDEGEHEFREKELDFLDRDKEGVNQGFDREYLKNYDLKMENNRDYIDGVQIRERLSKLTKFTKLNYLEFRDNFIYLLRISNEGLSSEEEIKPYECIEFLEKSYAGKFKTNREMFEGRHDSRQLNLDLR